MIVTLTEIKAKLGIGDTSQDTFLTEQLNLAQQAVENYCRRKFESTVYIETMYKDDFPIPKKNLQLAQYPLISISTLKKDSVTVTDYRTHKPSAMLVANTGVYFFNGEEEIEVTYLAGYATNDMPAIIKDVISSIVEERYNKKVSGVSLNFGSDVQRISIPGTLSIDFDYSLTSNERSNAFGTIIGNRANLLDFFRSERILGGGKLVYLA